MQVFVAMRYTNKSHKVVTLDNVPASRSGRRLCAEHKHKVFIRLDPTFGKVDGLRDVVKGNFGSI